MQANPLSNKTGLVWRNDVGLDIAANRARIALLETIFDVSPPETDLAPKWTASGYFDERGTCVASLEVARFGLMVSGTIHSAAGIRLVAVHPGWRGRGLSRDLMVAVLATLDPTGVELVLLYAETADLYRRYGFRPVPQHAFVGAAPLPIGPADARRLHMSADRALIERMAAARAPVSRLCALVGVPGLFCDRVAADADLNLVHLARIGAIVAYEIADETLVLVDVVAAEIPSLAEILGAIGGRFATVKTLFSPDGLGWSGEPVRDDTGLMIRGPIVEAMRTPFMLPPTSEF